MHSEPLTSSLHGLTTKEETFDKLIGDLDKRLDVYGQILSKQRYVAGEVRFFFLPPYRLYLDIITESHPRCSVPHSLHGALLPAAGSNILDAKPNVVRCVEFFSNKIFDFDVQRLNKVVEGHHVPPFLDSVKDGVKSAAAIGVA